MCSPIITIAALLTFTIMWYMPDNVHDATTAVSDMASNGNPLDFMMTSIIVIFVLMVVCLSIRRLTDNAAENRNNPDQEKELLKCLSDMFVAMRDMNGSLNDMVEGLNDLNERLALNEAMLKKIQTGSPTDAGKIVAVQNEMLRRVLEREYSLPNTVYMKMRPLGSAVSGTIVVHTSEACTFIPRGVKISRKVTAREEHGWLALRLESAEMAALVLRTCKLCDKCRG